MFTFMMFVFGVIIGSVFHVWLVQTEKQVMDEVRHELAKAKPSIAALKALGAKL